MKVINEKLGNIIINYDKKRKPLSTIQRNKIKGEYPYYGAQEIIDYVNNYIFEGEFILLAEDGENLRTRIKPLVKIVDGKFWLNNHAHIFKVKEGYNLKFIYYSLLKKDIQPYITGTTQPKLNQENMNKIELQIPELAYQNKIVYILNIIDKKIELNNQINDNLQEITSKLYEEIFVTNRNEDWKEYILTDIANINNGYSYKGTELAESSEIGMATIKNFERTGGFKEEGFKPLEPLKSKGAHYAEKFDVLVACTDLTQNAEIIGNAIILLSKDDFKKIIISMDLVKILPKLEFINNYMLYSILSSKEFKNFALGYIAGTTVLHLNKDCFKEFSIRLPDKVDVEKFVKIVKPMYVKMSKIIEENKTLEQLRDALLPKLMNGEIDLDKIEI